MHCSQPGAQGQHPHYAYRSHLTMHRSHLKYSQVTPHRHTCHTSRCTAHTEQCVLLQKAHTLASVVQPAGQTTQCISEDDLPPPFSTPSTHLGNAAAARIQDCTAALVAGCTPFLCKASAEQGLLQLRVPPTQSCLSCCGMSCGKTHVATHTPRPYLHHTLSHTCMCQHTLRW